MKAAGRLKHHADVAAGSIDDLGAPAVIPEGQTFLRCQCRVFRADSEIAVKLIEMVATAHVDLTSEMAIETTSNALAANPTWNGVMERLHVDHGAQKKLEDVSGFGASVLLAPSTS